MQECMHWRRTGSPPVPVSVPVCPVVLGTVAVSIVLPPPLSTAISVPVPTPVIHWPPASRPGRL